MIRDFFAQRKELAGNLASVFCGAARLNGIAVGLLMGVAFGTAFTMFDSWLIFFLLVAGIVAVQIAHILICKREGLSDYLFGLGFRTAGLGVGSPMPTSAFPPFWAFFP